MSERDAEVLREVYDAFNRRDLAAIERHCSPDISWRWGRHFFETDALGWPAVREFFDRWLESLPDTRVEVEQILDAGDRLVALLRQTGSGPGSGVGTEMTYAQVITFEEGLVRDVRNYLDREEALATAGQNEG
jgi:ketosteroid isomerase-like protein